MTHSVQFCIVYQLIEAEQNGRQFPDNIFKYILLNKNI